MFLSNGGETLNQISLAQQLAHETDDEIVYQACVQLCLTVGETQKVVKEWKAIRARVESRKLLSKSKCKECGVNEVYQDCGNCGGCYPVDESCVKTLCLECLKDNKKAAASTATKRNTSKFIMPEKW